MASGSFSRSPVSRWRARAGGSQGCAQASPPRSRDSLPVTCLSALGRTRSPGDGKLRPPARHRGKRPPPPMASPPAGSPCSRPPDSRLLLGPSLAPSSRPTSCVVPSAGPAAAVASLLTRLPSRAALLGPGRLLLSVGWTSGWPPTLSGLRLCSLPPRRPVRLSGGRGSCPGVDGPVLCLLQPHLRTDFPAIEGRGSLRVVGWVS